jgi:hypothetical protein
MEAVGNAQIIAEEEMRSDSNQEMDTQGDIDGDEGSVSVCIYLYGSLNTYTKKMASNIDIIILHMQINMDVEQLLIKYDAKKIVGLQQDEGRKHEDVVRNDLSSNSHILTHVYLYGSLHTYIQKKMASDTDTIILHMQINIMVVEEGPIKDNAVQIVYVEKDEDWKRAPRM